MHKNKTESIVLGGGCFWCLHSSYGLINGVVEVRQGYAGGTVPNPTYEEVSRGKTGHAEVVDVTYDATIILLDDILNIFWAIHDPTTLNRQGHDIGEEYRSIILYHTDQQKTIIEKSFLSAQALWNNKIITEIKPLSVFYPAESYQYDYKTNRTDYCQIIINPKLAILREKFPRLLKNG